MSSIETNETANSADVESALPPMHIDQNVDLLEYLRALVHHKYRILIAATLGAMTVFALSYLAEEKFGASVLVAVNINEEPGGVSPKAYRSSDTLGLLEHDFIIDAANSHSNEIQRMLATISSMRFSEEFIQEQNLLPYLFKESWDADNNKWIDDFTPDMRVASIRFSEIRGIKHDDDTGLLTVGFTTDNPNLSAQLANAFVTSFNAFTKRNQSQLILKRREYLNKRLQEIDNIELHRSIFRMIETQLGAESLLHAREDYPLEVIQPALPPLFKSSPKRKQWAALAFIGLLFLGVMVTIGTVLLSKLLAMLEHYNLSSTNKAATELQQLEAHGQEDAADEWDEGYRR